MSKPPAALRRSFWPKRRAPPPPPGARAEPTGFQGVRLSLLDDLEATGFFFQQAGGAAHPQRDPVKVLALSGGGAGGAFGAGALVGLSRAGARPTFDLVTGVSTGALIAPFALLGPAWDEKLQDAYTGGYAAELLGLASVRPGMSLYPAERLEALVGRYVDSALIDAVADAHRAGRRLFVATANLDAQTTSIWDMGGIAARGGPHALRLFADILIASASVPGVFPPKLLRVEADGIGYDELHVDGGAISPLFVVPEPLILHRARAQAAGGAEVYVLVNTTLEPTPRPTPLGAVPVLVRSFELMLRSSYRNAVRSVAAFCQLNGFPLHSASIPLESDGANMLRFDREAMTRLFEHGAEIAEAGRLWRRSEPL